MKSNYAPRLELPGFSKTLSRSEQRMALALKDYYDKLYDEDIKNLTDTLMRTWVLGLQRRYHYTPDTLREIYYDVVSFRAEAKRQYRALGNPAEQIPEQRTGFNTEDVFIRGELRRLGIDTAEWDSALAYNSTSGELTINWERPKRRQCKHRKTIT